MVAQWLPEPGEENTISSVSPEVVMNIAESSDSEDEVAEPSEQGYQPLSQEDPSSLVVTQSGSSDEESNENASGGVGIDGTHGEEEGAIAMDIKLNITSNQRKGSFSKETSDEIPIHFNVHTTGEQVQVWSGPTAQPDIEIGAEQAEQIRTAMSSFTLPSSAIPAWAASVPEDEWKQQLLARIKNLQQSTSHK
uniref:Male-enhanced antigen 1 n=1 Tax=Timema monikensis TaxID=170555 RepID=A0A7R9HSK9_9NEOP|nr:unnamed protein product [Timema monikensis]